MFTHDSASAAAHFRNDSQVVFCVRWKTANSVRLAGAEGSDLRKWPRHDSLDLRFFVRACRAPVLNPWLRMGAAWARPGRRSQQTKADGLSLTSSCTDVGFNNIKPRLPEVWGSHGDERISSNSGCPKPPHAIRPTTSGNQDLRDEARIPVARGRRPARVPGSRVRAGWPAARLHRG
jgi:hypothetical protein